MSGYPEMPPWTWDRVREITGKVAESAPLDGAVEGEFKTDETFACGNCGQAFDKTRPEEEAAAEARELFPGIDMSNPGEAAIVCDDCFNSIMGRVREEAPELTGKGWRNGTLLYERLVSEQGFTENLCRDCCQDGDEHWHLRTPGGSDVILWADGRWSGYDLTQPARLIYPAGPPDTAAELGITDDELAREQAELDAMEPACVPGIGIVSALAAQMLREMGPGLRSFRNRIPRAGKCCRTESGFAVHVKPDCRCPR